MIDASVSNSLNWVDAVIVIILLFFIAQGFMKGMVQELMILISWIVSALVAQQTYSFVASFVKPYVNQEKVLICVSWAIVFIPMVLGLGAFVKSMSYNVKRSKARSFDTAMGMLLGALKGGFTVCVLYMLYAYWAGNDIALTIRHAKFNPMLEHGADVIVKVMPHGPIRNRLEESRCITSPSYSQMQNLDSEEQARRLSKMQPGEKDQSPKMCPPGYDYETRQKLDDIVKHTN